MLGQCFTGTWQESGFYLALLMAGMVGSLTHCTGMCAPFVVAQQNAFNGGATNPAFENNPILIKLSSVALLPYHIGRITTYVVLAILFQSVLNVAFLFLPIKNFVVVPMLLVAALLFLASAFPSVGQYFPFLQKLTLRVPQIFKATITKSLMTSRVRISRFTHQYIMGVLLGFMPCGLVSAVLMATSTAPSAAQAGLGMAIFGLGTVPMLIAVAACGGALKRMHPDLQQKISKLCMVGSSLWLLATAVMMVL